MYLPNHSITEVLNILNNKIGLSKNILIKQEENRLCLYYKTFNSHSPKISIYLGMYLALNIFNTSDFEIGIKNLGINYRLNATQFHFIKDYDLI